MTSRALRAFAAILAALLSPSAALADDLGAEAVPRQVLVSSADLGATALDWYTSTVEAQPVPPGMLSLSKAKALFLQLAGGTATGQINAPSFGVTSSGIFGPNGSGSWTGVYGYSFESGTQSLLFRNNSTEQWRISGASGDFTSPQSRNINTGGSATFSTYTASAGGFSARNATASLHLGTAGTENITWSVGNPLSLSFMTLEIGSSSTLLIDAAAVAPRAVGVATGSLGACAAGNAGSWNYDTTRNTFVECNATAWVPFAVTDAFGAVSATTVSVTTGGSGYEIGTVPVLPTGTPNIASGFGTSPTITSHNGGSAFVIHVGTGGVASTGVINGIGVSNGGAMHCEDATTANSNIIKVTSAGGASWTLTNYNSTTGAAAAWVASDNLYCAVIGF